MDARAKKKQQFAAVLFDHGSNLSLETRMELLHEFDNYLQEGDVEMVDAEKTAYNVIGRLKIMQREARSIRDIMNASWSMNAYQMYLDRGNVPPPLPETAMIDGAEQALGVPARTADWAFVGNKWRRIGTKINHEALSPELKDDLSWWELGNGEAEVWTQEMHGVGTGPFSRLTNDQVRNMLYRKGLTTSGSRVELARRYGRYQSAVADELARNGTGQIGNRALLMADQGERWMRDASKIPVSRAEALEELSRIQRMEQVAGHGRSGGDLNIHETFERLSKDWEVGEAYTEFLDQNLANPNMLAEDFKDIHPSFIDAARKNGNIAQYDEYINHFRPKTSGGGKSTFNDWVKRVRGRGAGLSAIEGVNNPPPRVVSKSSLSWMKEKGYGKLKSAISWLDETAWAWDAPFQAAFWGWMIESMDSDVQDMHKLEQEVEEYREFLKSQPNATAQEIGVMNRLNQSLYEQKLQVRLMDPAAIAAGGFGTMAGATRLGTAAYQKMYGDAFSEYVSEEVSQIPGFRNFTQGNLEGDSVLQGLGESEMQEYLISEGITDVTAESALLELGEIAALPEALSAGLGIAGVLGSATGIIAAGVGLYLVLNRLQSWGEQKRREYYRKKAEDLRFWSGGGDPWFDTDQASIDAFAQWKEKMLPVLARSPLTARFAKIIPARYDVSTYQNRLASITPAQIVSLQRWWEGYVDKRVSLGEFNDEGAVLQYVTNRINKDFTDRFPGRDNFWTLDDLSHFRMNDMVDDHVDQALRSYQQDFALNTSDVSWYGMHVPTVNRHDITWNEEYRSMKMKFFPDPEDNIERDVPKDYGPIKREAWEFEFGPGQVRAARHLLQNYEQMQRMNGKKDFSWQEEMKKANVTDMRGMILFATDKYSKIRQFITTNPGKKDIERTFEVRPGGPLGREIYESTTKNMRPSNEIVHGGPTVGYPPPGIREVVTDEPHGFRAAPQGGHPGWMQNKRKREQHVDPHAADGHKQQEAVTKKHREDTERDKWSIDGLINDILSGKETTLYDPGMSAKEQAETMITDAINSTEKYMEYYHAAKDKASDVRDLGKDALIWAGELAALTAMVAAEPESGGATTVGIVGTGSVFLKDTKSLLQRASDIVGDIGHTIRGDKANADTDFMDPVHTNVSNLGAQFRDKMLGLVDLIPGLISEPRARRSQGEDTPEVERDAPQHRSSKDTRLTYNQLFHGMFDVGNRNKNNLETATDAEYNRLKYAKQKRSAEGMPQDNPVPHGLEHTLNNEQGNNYGGGLKNGLHFTPYDPKQFLGTYPHEMHATAVGKAAADYTPMSHVPGQVGETGADASTMRHLEAMNVQQKGTENQETLAEAAYAAATNAQHKRTILDM